MISASARRLSVFKAVVEEGGFNRAAMRLDISQPSVGAHVRALERQAGHPLFERKRGARPRLTKAGEAVYSMALEVLRRGEEAAQQLDDLRPAQDRILSLAVHREYGQYRLPAHLASFARRSPGIRFVTHTGTIEDVVALVRARTVSLGLLPSLGAIAGLDSVVLGHEPMAIVVSPHHPLARKPSVTVADLAAASYVTGLRSSSYFEMTDRMLKRIGVDRRSIAMEVQDFGMVRELARHGAGVACIALCTVQDDLRAGALVRLSISGRPLDSFELRCAFHNPLPQPARRFMEHLREQLNAASA
jgi:DNA-binding transcriptional LysR family regulator